MSTSNSNVLSKVFFESELNLSNFELSLFNFDD